MNRFFAARAAMAVGLLWAQAAHAQSDHRSETRPLDRASQVARSCAGPLDEALVTQWALARSPEVQEARHRLAARAGRRVAAGVWLPSHPVLAATLSDRRRGAPDDLSVRNWSVSLSQEIEIGGQRGARVGIAEAEAEAEIRRAIVAEQDVVAAALGAFHEAIAAREALAFAQDLARTADALSALAEARAAEALLAGVEANVARAEAVRLGLIHVEAKRRSETSRFALAALLGCSEGDVHLPNAVAPGAASPDLPDRRQVEEKALTLRGDLQAADMERRVLEQRLSLSKRDRVPNVTISAFAERGEIDDRILGIGLSVPLPLPGPLGPSRAGEIAETRAQMEAAGSVVARVRRRVLSEAVDAFAKHQARQAALRLFPGDLLERARADLGAIREALGARQLGLREAVLWQRSLIEVLQSDIEARLAARLANIELRRVAGVLLEEPEKRSAR